MKICDTHEVRIYCGLGIGYTGKSYDIILAKEICQKYCDEVGLGLTFTKTEFIYTDGGEDGVIIGLINYPRFPSKPEVILEHAMTIGKELLEKLNQKRLSIATPTRTFMLEANPE